MDDRGQMIGAVEVFHDAGADVALESAYRFAREQAQKDPLTGLGNRRSLTAFIADQLALFARSGRRFSLIMLDLDHFKAINDMFGHAVGDQVLVEVARILRDSCRDLDLAVRYGGEEFTIVLPGIAIGQAVAIAERIRVQVQQSLIATEAAPGPSIPPLTVSIGISEASPGDNWSSLIARADAALYVAKMDGRNRVHLARAET
jgi:diguanylate cyclase (GGDEF)-like protein